jgi:hypothetical protein
MLISTGLLLPITYFIKADSSGHVLWAHSLPNRVRITQLKNDLFENIYMAGLMDSVAIFARDTLVTIGTYDWFFGKFDSSGAPLWAHSAGSANIESAWDISLDACNHVWITGGTNLSDTDFTFNDTTIPIPPGLRDPGILLEYSDSGRYISYMLLNSGGDDALLLLPNKTGGFYLVGDFLAADMVFGADTLVHIGTVEAILIAKYQSDSCFGGDTVVPLSIAPVMSNPLSFNLFPNPTSGVFSITCSSIPLSGTLVQICDLTGRVINQFPLSEKTTSIRTNGLANGMYICKIISPDGQAAVKKLIVEN